MDRTELSKLTVVKLKALLKKKGLSIAGKKDELIDRLTGNSQNDENTPVTKPKTRGKKNPEPDNEEEEEDIPKKSKPKAKGKRSAPDSDDENFKPSSKSQKSDDEQFLKKGSRKLDKFFYHSGKQEIYEDNDLVWNCMLNQTNISHNNNKYYIIQAISTSQGYFLFTRYGRVGEDGVADSKYLPSIDALKTAFMEKFKSKTGNIWKKGIRENFVSKPKKYTLLDMKDDDDDDDEDAGIIKKTKVEVNSSESVLEKSVLKLIEFIFDHDMFKNQMSQYELDVEKMPLGKISKEQVEKGNDILKKIKNILDGKSKGSLKQLSSEFYTKIPHAFGRKVPTPIDNLELLQKKFDLCNILADIEIAQNILKSPTQQLSQHPMDFRYGQLDCIINPLGKNEKEFEYVQTYFEKTKHSSSKAKILDVFKIDRNSEKVSYANFKNIKERKLLWHGTSVAVLVAILKTGLRIMPHSGGRVGKGIYFASLNEKSASYVGRSGNIGFMFLAEVALGKSHVILRDDSSIRKPPTGFDSVLALGTKEPNKLHDILHKFEEHDVIIPQGSAIPVNEAKGSRFMHSEYLVYDEGQVRLRYLLKINF